MLYNNMYKHFLHVQRQTAKQTIIIRIINTFKKYRIILIILNIYESTSLRQTNSNVISTSLKFWKKNVIQLMLFYP